MKKRTRSDTPALRHLPCNKVPDSFPGGAVVKNLPANVGDSGSIAGLGRPLEEGHGNPLQYACLGNPMDRGTRLATDDGVASSWM